MRRGGVLAALFLFFSIPSPLRGEGQGEGVVARVGPFPLTENMISDHQSVARAYGGPGLTREQAAFQLLESLAMQAVAERHGIRITPDMLEAEAARIDKETKSPEVLVRVGAAFRPPDARHRYLNTVCRPILVNQLLYGYFYWSPDQHRAARDAAWKMIARAHLRPGPTALKAAAGRFAYKEVSLSDGDSRRGGPSGPPAVLATYDATLPTDNPITKAAKVLKPGEVARESLDLRESLVVIQRLDGARAATVTLPKERFESWMAREMGAIPVLIPRRGDLQVALRNYARGLSGHWLSRAVK